MLLVDPREDSALQSKNGHQGGSIVQRPEGLKPGMERAVEFH